MTESNVQQSAPDDIPAASDVPAAEGQQERRGGGG